LNTEVVTHHSSFDVGRSTFDVRRSHSDVHVLNWLAPSIDDWGPVRSYADFKTDFEGLGLDVVNPFAS